MSRFIVFAWIACGLAAAFVVDQTPNVSTLAGMLSAAGIALSAHWALERRA